MKHFGILHQQSNPRTLPLRPQNRLLRHTRQQPPITPKDPPLTKRPRTTSPTSPLLRVMPIAQVKPMRR